jgi:hypothetical protein
VLKHHRRDHRPARKQAHQREERGVRGRAQRLGLEAVAVKEPVGDRQVLVGVGERDVETAEDQRQANDERKQREAERPGA